jgi:hypothetical protein
VQLCDPPDDGFLEAETYVGAFLNVFKTILKKPYIGFLKLSAFSWWCDID